MLVTCLLSGATADVAQKSICHPPENMALGVGLSGGGLADASTLHAQRCTSPGSQQAPDSATTREQAKAPLQASDRSSFPTEAKERERDRRRQEKEQGIEREVVKRKKVCEDHYDDCGDDLSSISEADTAAPTTALCLQCCDFDTDDELSDDDHNWCMAKQCGPLLAFPIDVNKVAKAQPGHPAPGRDPRAPENRSVSTCKACRH